MASANLLAQFVSIGVNIILATILVPEDFGLVALATTYIGFVKIFTVIGFGSAIIYERKSTQRQLSTLYWLNIGLCTLTFSLVIATIPLAAEFYEEPRLVNVAMVAATSIVLYPLFTIHYKIEERDLRFKLLSKVNVIALLIGAVVGISSAYAGAGVYAIVLQSVIANVTRLILILYHSNWKPSLQFDFGSVSHMVWYAAKFKLANTMLFLERNIDYLIMGKVFTPTILGYYSFAYNIMYAPVKRISTIFSEVLFPSFSAIKDSNEKIISGYFKSKQLIAMVAFPGMSILSFNAEWLITSVFGDKWIEAIPIVEILCFAGALQAISQIGSVVFASIGKPEVSTYITGARTVLTILAIYLGCQVGILLVAYYLVIAKVLSYLILLVVLFYFIPFTLRFYLKHLWSPIAAVILLILIQVASVQGFFVLSPIGKLTLMSVLSGVLIVMTNLKILGNLYSVLTNRVT